MHLKMKKLKYLNLGESLKREEMKIINGGIVDPNLCKSTCEAGTTGDAYCSRQRSNSYCSYLMCNKGSGPVQRWSCQFVSD